MDKRKHRLAFRLTFVINFPKKYDRPGANKQIGNDSTENGFQCEWHGKDEANFWLSMKLPAQKNQYNMVEMLHPILKMILTPPI